jgi:hypothetical protein
MSADRKGVDVLAALTPDEVAFLRDVQNGADVWGYGPAMHGRAIQRKAPTLIRIVRAKEQPPGHMRRPYYGCKATAAGKRALAAIARATGAES